MYSPRVATSISGVCEGEHFVEFYQDEATLIPNLMSFIGAAIKHGESCLVIATRKHLAALDNALAIKGIDVAAAKASRKYTALDAAETLVKFAPNGLPDGEVFKATIGPILAEITKGGQPVRAFGEMVALLWADGHQAGAVMLEEQWNKLIKGYPVTLFCAYPAHYFQGSLHSAVLREVGGLHSRTIVSKLDPSIG